MASYCQKPITYDWEQCHNHYRIWKQRLRSLSDLQKNTDMDWNSVDMRFDAPQHVLDEFKKKQQRYWKEHAVLPIHIEVGIWLGNEIVRKDDGARDV